MKKRYKLAADQGYHPARNSLKRLVRGWNDVDKYIILLLDENEKMKEENRKLEEENVELKYRPGQGFEETKSHFNELVNNLVT